MAVVRDLTTVTFPTTVDTLEFVGDSRPMTRYFYWSLLAIGLVGLVFAIYAFYLGSQKTSAADQTNYSILWQSATAAILGLLGSLVYIFFNMIGVMAEKAFSSEDRDSHLIRLVLGAIVGWVFFFGFVQSSGQSQTGSTAVMLLLPFLAGFSTRLVFGLINQAIRAIEITLNLEDKATSLSRRQSRSAKR